MNEENGCVQYVKGSHLGQVKQHRNTAFDDNRNIDGFEILDSDIDYSKVISCPLPAGAALIHHSRTIHRGCENRTNTPRRTYIATGGIGKPVQQEMSRNFTWQKKSPLFNSVSTLMHMEEKKQQGVFPEIAGWWEPKETIFGGDGGETLTSVRPGEGSTERCGWGCMGRWPCPSRFKKTK